MKKSYAVGGPTLYMNNVISSYNRYIIMNHRAYRIRMRGGAAAWHMPSYTGSGSGTHCTLGLTLCLPGTPAALFPSRVLSSPDSLCEEEDAHGPFDPSSVPSRALTAGDSPGGEEDVEGVV